MKPKTLKKELRAHLDELRAANLSLDAKAAALAWLRKHKDDVATALQELGTRDVLRGVDRRELLLSLEVSDAQLELAGIGKLFPRIIVGKPAVEATLADIEATLARHTDRAGRKSKEVRALQNVAKEMKAFGLPDTATVADLIRRKGATSGS